MRLKWYVRYTFYAFVFSLPLEMADVSIGGFGTVSKLLGYVFVLAALSQSSICFKRPPNALWAFGLYLVVLGFAGLTVIFRYPEISGLKDAFVSNYFTRIQLVAMVWLIYNVLRQEMTAKGALLSIAASTLVLVVLQFAGLTGESLSPTDRATAFGANPNGVATVIAVGVISVFGLAYGRETRDWRLRLLFWSTSGLLAISLVRTGSRGALVALILSFSILWLKKGSIATKVKLVSLGVIACVFLGIAAYQIPEMRERWEKTLLEGHTSGRDVIYQSALEMFLERPVSGWGPVYHFSELGARVRGYDIDPHNLYLGLLTELGLMGTVPFLFGLWMCWRACWKARFSVQGVVPLMMLTFLLIGGLKGSWHKNKLFWFVIAYTLASATYAEIKRRRPDSALVRSSRQAKMMARVNGKN
jgi:O-antigen ligase